MGPAISFTLWCILASIKKIKFECVLRQNCALFSSSCLHYLYRSHSACECSIGTRQYYASDVGARRGGHGPPLWLCNKVLKPNFQSIIFQTNNGCSLLSLILAKLLLLDINFENVYALFRPIVNASGVATGWRGVWGLQPFSPLSLK